MGSIPWRILCSLLIAGGDLTSSQFIQINPPLMQAGPPGPLPGGGPQGPPGGYPQPPVGYPPLPGGYPSPPGGYPTPPGGYQPPTGGYPPPPVEFSGPPPLPKGQLVFKSLVFEYGNAAPDNYIKNVITINGQFPGPPIRVKMYDILNIEVNNKLDHGIVLHFHGIRNYGEPEADGVPQVTQNLIPPGTVFRYRVSIGFQSGTFMYHLHNGLDSIGAVGPLIIEDDLELLANHAEYNHIWDHTFILQQWYHQTNSKLLEGLEGNPYNELPEPDSILINGRSYGEWNNESNTISSQGYEVITVKAGATYRFRVIGFGVNSILTFKIAGHTMKIIAVDGIITNPIKVDHLQVNSGQRYSVLVTMNQAADNYFIESEMIPGPGPKNGKTILNYEGVAVTETWTKKVESGQTAKLKLTQWENLNLSPNEKVKQPDIYLPPQTVDKEIIIKSHQKNTSSGIVKFHVNGEIYKDPTVPLLFQVRTGVNITKEPPIYESLTNKSIQIVFQNLARQDGICEQHPWHLHGHSFYIVGQGPGEYDKEKDGKAINKRVEEDPKSLVFRDVVTLYPNVSSNSSSKLDTNTNSTTGTSIETNVTTTAVENAKKTTTADSNATMMASPKTNTNLIPDLDKPQLLTEGTPCGWVAIRFVTDNPGVWLAHCHLTAHLIMGEEFVLREYQESNPLIVG